MASPFSRWIALAISVIAAVGIAATVVSTQSPDDLKAVLRELEAIKKELAEVKALVQQQRAAVPAPAPAPARPNALGKMVDVAGAAFKGRADAPITIVEFSDYQCPFCARHVAQTIPSLDKEYIESGKVKYVFRNYPIESIHPNAMRAAVAAECASEQQKFWPMHDRLFANQQMLAEPQLTVHATAVGLTASAFQACLKSGKFDARIRKDMNDAVAIGITGTPGFAIGKTNGSNPIRVDAFIPGARAFAGFKTEIDRLLAQ
jgi:protein-disulfide isomerase